MRAFIVTLLFFFAPVILMFALRHLALLLRIWLAWRRNRAANEHVIDITPARPSPASRGFIAVAIIVGVICAALVWMRLGDESGPPGAYVPAHIDAQGHVIPGQYQKP